MITYKLTNNEFGQANVTIDRDQYVFGYPCKDSSPNCSSYTVTLSDGFYRIEAWGSRSNLWISTSKFGQGGYTSGILKVNQTQTLYLFVGSAAIFNNYMLNPAHTPFGGASSDVRLYVNDKGEWFDPVSLRSRIMVSGGGGSAEWSASIGGHGGGLIGAPGQSDCGTGSICPEIISTGGTQTTGGFQYSPINKFKGSNGLFGIAPTIPGSADHGGMGGNGYWSGATINYAGSGGGGSSFVSGHVGCIALNSSANENPSETNSSIHYSGISFINPSMQQGNTTMPLYYKRNSYGIGNRSIGAIRITILNYLVTCKNTYYSSKIPYIFVFIFMFDS